MRSRWDQLGIPNPGSREAQDQGCMCPVLDNHRGLGVPMTGGELSFWVDERCPMHVMISDVKTDLV